MNNLDTSGTHDAQLVDMQFATVQPNFKNLVLRSV